MYRSYDYECHECGWSTVELFEPSEKPEFIECQVCKMHAKFVFRAPNVMNHALPDGTKRFAELKTVRKLQRTAAEAKRDGDKYVEHTVKQDLKRLKKGD